MGLKIVVAATATSPLLAPLVHALSHQPNLEVSVLTRPTPVPVLPRPHIHNHEHDHDHDHSHSSNITHTEITFKSDSFPTLLANSSVLILLLTGSDLHFSLPLIQASSLIPTLKLIIPSEFGLCTSNPKIRELLPPYQTRYLIQEELKKSGKNWKAIYSGLLLEDALTTSGVLSVDCLWGSVVVFPHENGLKVPISTYRDVAEQIVGLSTALEEGEDKENEVYTSGFRASLDEIVTIVEKKLDIKVDRYEGLLDGARSEAKERFRLGYTDGGIALIARVAVWDESVGAWSGWGKANEEENKKEWEEEVGKIAVMVRKGEVEAGGCGC